MKSFMASPATIERKWYVVDAEGQTLGRLSTAVASVLRGKNKPTFTPHIDTGDYVVVVNAGKIKVTGKKPTAHIEIDSTVVNDDTKMTALATKLYGSTTAPAALPTIEWLISTFCTGNG